MKKTLLFLLFTFPSSVFTSFAQVRMRDMFASMPDSLLPMMTKNNRLDCIDFIENNMQAQVRNRLDEFVELKKMTDDYLLLETSAVSKVEMKLVQKDDTTSVIYVARTYVGPAVDCDLKCYTQDWQPLTVQKACRPSVEEFFPECPDEQKEELQHVILMLKDLTFASVEFSETEAILTWHLYLDELPREERELAKRYVRPVVRRL